jgi:Ca2+-binding RTX toxin-like protein
MSTTLGLRASRRASSRKDRGVATVRAPVPRHQDRRDSYIREPHAAHSKGDAHVKNLFRLKRTREPKPAWLASSAVAVALAAAVAAAILAGPGSAASAVSQAEASLGDGVLTVEGTNGSDRIALRLQAGQPGTLEVDVGDDGSADFSFARRAIAKIVVDAGNGDDSVRIDEGNGVFGDTIPTTIDGGNGSDRLVGGSGAGTLIGGNGDDILSGGSGAEKLDGGNGNDSIDGNRGNDVALMGNGDDTFIWDPGDGSDTVEGQNGEDTMVFNGANGAEHVDLSANGNRLKFFRDVASITMDTAGVERVDFNALGGADVVTVNDLTGTDVKEFNVDLAGTLGGTEGDGQADRVIVNGTDGNDTIHVDGNAGGVRVNGLAPTIRVFHSEAANDRLEINTLAGADTVNAAALEAGAIQLFVDGLAVS